ncbi:hypothetical protein ACFOOL_02870 [Devosia honganensis]|uniref:TIGR02588 family protein n=1 Tax=Devosia honganensis TaxID=1610527 RepID=A0ABV7WYU1_9HYPH
MSEKDSASNNGKNGQTHFIEWVLGGISTLIVLGLAGFLTHEALTKTGSEPVLSLQVLRVVEQEQSSAVVIAVRNAGHATAADVEVAGVIDGDPVIRHVTLDYVPAESEREVTLNFASPLDEERLELLILGHAAP